MKAGRVVKGVNFVDIRDAGDPVEIARRYDQAGADELVFLDITASHEDRKIMLDVVRQVAEQCFMPLTVGGGIRTIEDVTALIQAGAEKVSIMTAAVLNPDIVTQTAKRFGRCATVVTIDPKRVAMGEFLEHRRERGLPVNDAVVLSALTDGRPGLAASNQVPSVFEVHTHGGRKPTGLSAADWAREVVRLGAGEIMLTSMDADGTLNGYDLEMTAAVTAVVDVPVVASGGCGSPQHMVEVIQQAGADAVLAASIFHYGQYTIAQAKDYLAERGVCVRKA